MTNTPPTTHAPTRHKLNGPDMAAVLAACIGLLALGLAVVYSELRPASKDLFLRLGSWIPGYAGIGPYSGKETVMLLAWLGSWLGLHFAWRHKHIDPRPWFGVALGCLLVGLLLIWPPVWHLLGA